MPPVVAMRRFASGEVTPELYAGTDTQAYLTGLRRLRNAYVMRMGGVQSRAGTLYKGTTKNNGAVRLFSVVFDVNENYVLEFGNLYLRVWRDGSLVSVGTPAAWLTATAYTAGAVRANGGTNYVCILDHTSGASTEPGVGASWTTNWYALTGTTFEYPTPYTTAQLSALQIAYLYHVVTIVHPSHPPANLTWLADASWVLADIDFTETASGLAAPTSVAIDVSTGAGIGWVVTATDSLGNESASSLFVQSNVVAGAGAFAAEAALAATPVTVSWNSVSGASGYNVYRKASDGTNYALLLNTPSTSYTDNGFIFISTYDIVAPGSSEIVAGLFAATDKYPAVVGAYQQRLLLAATNDDPDNVYASRSANPYDFSVSDPLVDSDALSWRQVGQRLNRIRFFSEIGARLIQFTDTGETFVQGSEDNILRPGEINPRQISWNGISPTVPPLLVDDTALYVQARGTQVRDLVPVNQEGYTGTELSRTALHFFDGYEIVDAAYQKVPHSVCWFVRDDGKVVSLTYVREGGIFGFALHDFGGVVERIVTVWEGDEDAVYLVVNRTIDGGTVRYMERFGNRLATVTGGEFIASDVSVPITVGTPTEMPANGNGEPQPPVRVVTGTAGLSDYTVATIPTTAPTSGFVMGSFSAGRFAAYNGITGRVFAVNSNAFSDAETRLGAYSDDGGETWTEVQRGTVSDATAYLPSDVFYWREKDAWVVSADGEDGSGDQRGYLAVSTDDAATWTYSKLGSGVAGDEWTFRRIAASPTALRVYAEYSPTTMVRNIALSTDGRTFSLETGTGYATLDDVLYVPALGLWIAVGFATDVATEVSIFSSSNGKDFTVRYTHTTGDQASLAFNNQRVVVVFGDGSGGYSTTGLSWTVEAFTGDAAGFAAGSLAYHAPTGTFYACGDSTGGETFVASTDGGATWTVATGLWAGDNLLSSLIALPENGRLLFFQGAATPLALGVSALPAGGATITGLSHIEGEDVSVTNAGAVVTSPYNASYTTLTVTDGAVALPTGTYTTVVVGLPFVTDIQTLDIDSTATTIKDRDQFSGGVIAWVRDTGAFWAGPAEPSSATSVADLERIVPVDENWDAVATQTEGTVQGVTLATWNKTGRVWLRQVDPLPMTILGISPQGTTGGR